MKRHNLIIEQIRSRWSDRPAVDYCRKILDFVVQKPEQLSRHLTYRHIGNIAETSPTNDELQLAVTILSSRFRVLELHMIFIDQSGDEHDLSDAELKALFDDGEFADPETGILVPDADSMLVPYFRAFKDDLLAEASDPSASRDPDA